MKDDDLPSFDLDRDRLIFTRPRRAPPPVVLAFLGIRGSANQLHELAAGGDIRVKMAQHGAGDRAGVLLLNAAHHHAQVMGL